MTAPKWILVASLIACAVFGWLTASAEPTAHLEGYFTITVIQPLGQQDGGGGNASEPLLFNVTLLILGSEGGGEPNLQGLNVTVHDLNGTVVAYGVPNSTGHVDLKLPEGVYTVSVNHGYRVVGRRKINVTEPGLFMVRTWVYNLTVECVDLQGEPLADHVVYLYDQLVFHSLDNFTVIKNGTGRIIGWNKTDLNGRTSFNGLWNGTYLLKVVGGEPVGEAYIKLQKHENITIECSKTRLVFRLVSTSGEVISGATVYFYDSEGNLIFKEYTDENGCITRESLYAERYVVDVVWEGLQVWTGIVDLHTNDEWTIECPLYRLRVRVLDPSGEPIRNALVVVSRLQGRYGRLKGEVLYREKTDEWGYVRVLLPTGRYEVRASYGIYTSVIVVDLLYDMDKVMTCSVNMTALFLTLVMPVPLVALIFVLERKKLKKPLEIRKYKEMLSKLENLYENGLIEYKLYRKLRDEYETKLMELGGRMMR